MLVLSTNMHNTAVQWSCNLPRLCNDIHCNYTTYLCKKALTVIMFVVASFYNWETQMSTSNATPNYQVTAENAAGLLFKNKRDRKILNVDPKVWQAIASLDRNIFLCHKCSTNNIAGCVSGNTKSTRNVQDYCESLRF